MQVYKDMMELDAWSETEGAIGYSIIQKYYVHGACTKRI